MTEEIERDEHERHVQRTTGVWSPSADDMERLAAGLPIPMPDAVAEVYNSDRGTD